MIFGLAIFYGHILKREVSKCTCPHIKHRNKIILAPTHTFTFIEQPVCLSIYHLRYNAGCSAVLSYSHLPSSTFSSLPDENGKHHEVSHHISYTMMQHTYLPHPIIPVRTHTRTVPNATWAHTNITARPINRFSTLREYRQRYGTAYGWIRICFVTALNSLPGKCSLFSGPANANRYSMS